MKVLVSGGGGYVGNVLCRDLLDRGYEVKCVDNFHKGHCDQIISLVTRPGFEFHRGDVSNPDHAREMWESADACIHLAALVGYPACKAQPSLAEAVNIGGTQNILKYADGRPVIFASTGSVYGSIEGVCDENSPLNAVSLYGETKKTAEQLVTNTENTVSFRFATGFGVSPNMRVNLLVNDLVYQCVHFRCACIFQADFRRTFIHVKDMSRCFIFGMERLEHLNHKVYNAGSNELNATKRQLADMISGKTGAFIAYNDFNKDADQRDYEVDYSRLENEGFECLTSLEEGIDELIAVSPLIQINHQYM